MRVVHDIIWYIYDHLNDYILFGRAERVDEGKTKADDYMGICGADVFDGGRGHHVHPPICLERGVI